MFTFGMIVGFLINFGGLRAIGFGLNFILLHSLIL
jgi:hypothetical protein